uniref:Uncharacterized protein n=1 Tax=Romanomermis culicivorax TaxID=13658 RepID=A0A915IZ53_ROMCU
MKLISTQNFKKYYYYYYIFPLVMNELCHI